MQPIVNGLEAEFTGRVSFLYYDLANPENERLQSHYETRGHPTAVVLDREGNVAARFFGQQDPSAIREALEEILRQPAAAPPQNRPRRRHFLQV